MNAALPPLLTLAFGLWTTWSAASNLAAPAPPATADQPQVVLAPQQVQALGVHSQPPGAQGAAAGSYPAMLRIPSNQQHIVSTPLPGLLESLLVSVGDQVKAGQVVAVVRSAQAQEMRADIGGLQAQADTAARALARDEQLLREGLIAEARIDATRAQSALAQSQLTQRRSLLDRHRIDGADGRVLLRATLSGVVVERPVSLGQRLDGDTAVLRIARVSALWVELQVPVEQAAQVRPGMAVQVVGAAQPAVVLLTGPTVDPASQTVLVRALLKQAPATLRPGQAVQARLSWADPGVTQVPDAAVMRQGQRAFVFVDQGQGQYRAQAVQPVSSSGGHTAVRGLPASARVVVRGTAALKSLLGDARS